ncbi:MAG TPA: MEDS domain-containing protein [Burkholderiales bacterium]|nr:MEDS domain-containing protein [Burkholderiales bacterium]
MPSIPVQHASWRELLSAPPPGSHPLQIYDGDAFLASAVSHFAAEGLRKGEAVLLNGLPHHTDAIRASLEAGGVDARAALRHGQLTIFDVREGLGSLDGDGTLSTEQLHASLCEMTRAARQDGRFPGVRWWGELTNLLYQRGEREAAFRVERVAGEAALEAGTTILCSFLGDRFDAAAYDGLHAMCCAHSHVIPAADYAANRLAVNRAIADVVGELRGSLLQSLSLWKGPACDQPSSQAILFWLRETLPERFDAVLARARAHHQLGSMSFAP